MKFHILKYSPFQNKKTKKQEIMKTKICDWNFCFFYFYFCFEEKMSWNLNLKSIQMEYGQLNKYYDLEILIFQFEKCAKNPKISEIFSFLFFPIFSNSPDLEVLKIIPITIENRCQRQHGRFCYLLFFFGFFFLCFL